MSAQTITVTTAAPNPAAITLSANISAMHISGEFGSGEVVIEASHDGTAPYAKIVAASDVGTIGAYAGIFNVILPAGWRVRARAVKPVTSVVVAVE